MELWLIPSRARDFCLQSVYTGPGAHPAHYLLLEALSVGVKQPGCEGDCLSYLVLWVRMPSCCVQEQLYVLSNVDIRKISEVMFSVFPKRSFSMNMKFLMQVSGLHVEQLAAFSMSNLDKFSS
jgi:hypothetical protein